MGDKQQQITRYLMTTAAQLMELVKVENDVHNRFRRDSDGKMEWGSGAAAVDTNLYRGAANVLQSDDTFNPVLGYQANGVALSNNISMVAAAGAANVCEVTMTLQDGTGATIAIPRPFLIWLSDSATGAGLTATTASGNVTAKASNGADFGALTSKKAFMAQPLATGIFILSITDTAKTGFYVCAQCPFTGKVLVSSQLVTGNYG